MSAGPVRVAFSDDALATIAAHLAGGVDGVVGLQPRRAGRLRAGAVNGLARAGAGRRPRTPVAAGVEIHRAGGSVEVALQVVTTLAPPPIETARAVVRAVRSALEPLTGAPVTVVVSIVAVSG